MFVDYTPEQKDRQSVIRDYIDRNINPHADEWDAKEEIPRTVFSALGSEGFLTPGLAPQFGGSGMDSVTLGILMEEMGKASVSVVSDLTVHGMCVEAIQRFASDPLRDHYLPRMAKGETLGAFALTEPDIGSDARNVKTQATPVEGGYVLNGRKKWISFARMADLFLIVAQDEGQPSAFLVPRDTPGLSIKPIRGMLGFRSAMIGELQLDGVKVPTDHQIGPRGAGFSHVAANSLDFGRYCVAWACVGLTQACVDSSLHYAQNRHQFDRPLRDHQLILEMLANMITHLKAARALAWRCAYLRDQRDPASITETTTAKYFSSMVASKAASDAVQIHGANGCGPDYPVQRYFRDARIAEIIEGSNQMQQIMIAKNGYIENRKALKRMRTPASQ